MGRPKRTTHANRMAHCFIHAMAGIWFNETDKMVLMETLRILVERHGYKIVYFSLMSNHCHWIMEFTEDKSCGDVLGNVHTCLSKAYNKLHKRHGHVWRDRYKDVTIEEDSHCLSAITYVALNSLRSGAIKRVEDDVYSSYRAYAYGHKDGITSLPSIYETLGRTEQERGEEFKAILSEAHQAWLETRTWERIEKGEEVLVGKGRVSLNHLGRMFEREESLLRKMEDEAQDAQGGWVLAEPVKKAKDRALVGLNKTWMKLNERLASRGIPSWASSRFWAEEEFIVDFVSEHFQAFGLSCAPG